MQDNSKIFKFKGKADYVFYLSELIIDSIQKTDRLKVYYSEIERILNNNIEGKFVSTNLYESISDAVNRLFQYIFNLLGDESKKAVSYRKFRKVLFKQRNVLDVEIEAIPQKEQTILSDFNSLRNWALHIPESLFIQKKLFFKMDSEFILENRRTIAIPTYDNYEIKFLEQMKRKISEVLESALIIVERMKTDYKGLIGEDFDLKYEVNQVKPYVFMDAVEKSWNAQNGKIC